MTEILTYKRMTSGNYVDAAQYDGTYESAHVIAGYARGLGIETPIQVGKERRPGGKVVFKIDGITVPKDNYVLMQPGSPVSPIRQLSRSAFLSRYIFDEDPTKVVGEYSENAEQPLRVLTETTQHYNDANESTTVVGFEPPDKRCCGNCWASRKSDIPAKLKCCVDRPTVEGYETLVAPDDYCVQHAFAGIEEYSPYEEVTNERATVAALERIADMLMAIEAHLSENR